MDYISFSRRFFAATGVPVTLPEKGNPSSLSSAGKTNRFPTSDGTCGPTPEA